MKAKKTYKAWLASYLLIICVAFFCSIGIYLMVGNVVKKEVDRSNAVILENVKLSMDGCINDMQKIALDLGDNDMVASVCKPDLSDSDFEILSLQVQNELAHYQNINTNITNLYVYIDKKDYVISSFRSTDTDIAYDIMYKKTGITKSEWKHILLDDNRSAFCEMMASDEGGKISKELVFIRPLAVRNGVPNGALVVAVDGEAMNQTMEHGSFDKNSHLLLMDVQDHVIMSNTGKKLPVTYEMFKDGKQVKLQSEGQQYIFTSVKSDLLSMRYVLGIPSDTYYKTANIIRMISFVGIFVFLGLALLLAFRLLKKNYKPLRDLMGYVKTVYRDDEDENEYYLFQNAITKAVVEKKQMQSRLEQQKGLIKDHLLINLLKGKVENGVQLEDYLFACDADFDAKYYQVLVFYVEYYDELFEGSAVEMEEQASLAFLVVQNITQELLEKHFKTVYVDVDDMMVCLLNTAEHDSVKMLEILRRVVKEAQEIIKENFYIEFTISVSGLHEGAQGIASAYQEAMEAMEYKIVLGKKEIICFDELDISDESYYYPLEKELILINLLKTGELDKAEALLDELLYRNFEEKQLSLEMAKCIIFSLVSTVLKVIEDIHRQQDLDLTAETEKLSKLLERMDIAEIRRTLHLVFRNICKSVDRKNCSASQKVVEQIKGYVAENYGDFNLSLYSIAESYELTYSYLSRIFKTETGEGLLQYINKVRMEAAKKWLLETDKNLEEIAKLVGYGNSNSLIRAFKKHTGITPGKFRELKGK